MRTGECEMDDNHEQILHRSGQGGTRACCAMTNSIPSPAARPAIPGLPLGTNLNVSIWSDRPFDFQWVLVGATGTVPR